MHEYRHLFGPVPSRRLGISLGVDVVPHKVCSLNCVYCECGKTTKLTIERRDYVKFDEIKAELDDYLKKRPVLDYITLSGSGEPTLYSGIGRLIVFLKREYPQYKVAVLTNGTLLPDKRVRDEIADADLILPSLDTADEGAFLKVNRPHGDLSLGRIIGGLVSLREEFKGEIWLEVFIVPRLNDSKEQLELLRKAIVRIRPDKVQLNTLDRPGAENWVMPTKKADLERIAELLGGDIIADFTGERIPKSFSNDIEESILATVRRRPCTLKDLSNVLGLHMNEINKYIGTLLKDKRITAIQGKRDVFFKIAQLKAA